MVNECLTDEDKVACLNYNCGHVEQLMHCNPDYIIVACKAILAMMSLTSNTYEYLYLK